MQPGERRIVWAYHNTSDFIDVNWQKHTEKGFEKIAFLKEPKPRGHGRCYNPRYCATPTPLAKMIAAPVVGNLVLIITVIVFCSFLFAS